MHDSGGDLFDLINQLITKKVFSNAVQIRFIIPITIAEITEQRGTLIREHFDLLTRIFKDNITEIADSVMPILTTKKISKTEFDLYNDAQFPMSEQLDETLKKDYLVPMALS